MSRRSAGFASVFLLAGVTCIEGQTTFTNSAAITSPVGAGTPGGFPPGPGVAYSPYPSNINVSGLTGTISKVTVALNNVSLDRPDDLVILLQGPTGANLVIVSDAGGTTAASNVTITLDDAAANQLPDNGPLTGGTFKPTAVQSSAETFPSPAPGAGNYAFPAPAGSATLASQFNGTNPNGQWRLFVVDDALGPPTGIGGTIAGGWSITITTAVAAAPTATTLSSSPNPSFTTAPNNIATFTATVTSGGNPVTQGMVTFIEGATVLAGPMTVNGVGQATFSTSALGQGNHVIRADYGGATGFAVSSGNVSHFVHNHTTQSGNMFCNPGPISIPAGSSGGPDPATPYPSSIFVAGLSGSITTVTLTLNGLTSARPDDLDLLLVRSANKFVFMSDVGGQNAVSGINLTFSDAAGSLLSAEGTLTSGTFRPTSDNSPTGVNFPAPAPAAPYNRAAPAGAETFLSTFTGSPNGTWDLFVVDDSLGGGGGSIGSYCLTFGTTSDAPTTTTVTSSQNPSFTTAPNNSVTFTAEVNRTSDGSNVTVGTITFREGMTVLAGPIALNASGTASFTTTSLSEGLHVITADYSGAPGSFNFSSGSVEQTVDNHTVVTGNTFCNPGPIAINGSGAATPYPSRIFVSGLGAALSTMTLSLNGLTHPRPDDIDVLMVSPAGQNFVPMSDTGGVNAVSGVTLTLSDSAASLIPDDMALTTGTFRPTSVNALGQNSFPSPAPSGPYNNAAPAGTSTFTSLFRGANPNGTWSLFVVDDSLGQAGSFASGACVSFTLPSDLTLTKSHSGNFNAGQAGMYTITVNNLGPAASTGEVTVSDTLPAGLTATALAGTGWSCNLAMLTCTRSDALASGASYPPITLTVNVAANAPSSVTNMASVSGGGELNTANNTATDPTTIIQTVSVTVNTAPAGRSFTVDGNTYTSAQTFSWLIGSTHDLSTTSPQDAGATRYLWESWSDGGAISHTVTANAPATYTANFKTQHLLTTSVSPPGSGTIAPPTGYFDQGTTVQVTATVNAGFTFVNFSGDLTGSTNPQSVVMSAPRSVVANFTGTPTALTALITAKSGPAAARVWTITITNAGAGTAASAQVSSLALTQTGGAACTPSIVAPALPLTIGSIAPGGSVSGDVTLNFAGCAANARFTAVIGFGANNGAITNSRTLYNQFQ